MWATDVGRYGASNYDILKAIFECNLKLFTQAGKKKLLFVIRDFNFNKNNEMKTKLTIGAGLDHIWQSIYKPD